MNTASDLVRQNRRTPPFILTFLAVAFVVLGIVNVALVRSMSATAQDHTLRQIFDLFVSFFLSCALYYGVRWVRWVVVVLASLSAVVSFLGFAHVAVNAPKVLSFWLLFNGAFYGFAAWLLIFSPPIVSYFFRPTSRNETGNT